MTDRGSCIKCGRSVPIPDWTNTCASCGGAQVEAAYIAPRANSYSDRTAEHGVLHFLGVTIACVIILVQVSNVIKMLPTAKSWGSLDFQGFSFVAIIYSAIFVPRMRKFTIPAFLAYFAAISLLYFMIFGYLIRAVFAHYGLLGQYSPDVWSSWWWVATVLLMMDMDSGIRALGYRIQFWILTLLFIVDTSLHLIQDMFGVGVFTGWRWLLSVYL